LSLLDLYLQRFNLLLVLFSQLSYVEGDVLLIYREECNVLYIAYGLLFNLFKLIKFFLRSVKQLGKLLDFLSDPKQFSIGFGLLDKSNAFILSAESLSVSPLLGFFLQLLKVDQLCCLDFFIHPFSVHKPFEVSDLFREGLDLGLGFVLTLWPFVSMELIKGNFRH
jgi:hypothetical protein